MDFILIFNLEYEINIRILDSKTPQLWHSHHENLGASWMKDGYA